MHGSWNLGGAWRGNIASCWLVEVESQLLSSDFSLPGGRCEQGSCTASPAKGDKPWL